MAEINNYLKELSIKGHATNGSICNVLSRLGYGFYKGSEYYPQFIKHCQSWAYYSGNPDFPVPTSFQDLTYRSAESAYFNAGNTTHGRWGGDYGLLRKDLAHHLSQCEWINPCMEN